MTFSHSLQACEPVYLICNTGCTDAKREGRSKCAGRLFLSVPLILSLSVYSGHSCETSGVNQIKCLWFAANKTELIL